MREMGPKQHVRTQTRASRAPSAHTPGGVHACQFILQHAGSAQCHGEGGQHRVIQPAASDPDPQHAPPTMTQAPRAVISTAPAVNSAMMIRRRRIVPQAPCMSIAVGRRTCTLAIVPSPTRPAWHELNGQQPPTSRNSCRYGRPPSRRPGRLQPTYPLQRQLDGRRPNATDPC